MWRQMRGGLRWLWQVVGLLALLFAAVPPASAADLLPAPFTGRWIDVNLTTLRATAYQGSKAVYTAPVTTGKRGYATPTGTYYIFSRVRVQDMESLPGDREHYLVKDVQYVQYFRAGGFALHANYWQPSSVFGRVNTSHGCVGMPLAHARYFWNFAGIGTPVYVHRGASPAAAPVVRVDSVVGKDQADARSALVADGLKVAVKPKTTMAEAPGTVLSQSPVAGRTAAKGATVTLTVAEMRALAPLREAAGDDAWAPDVVGLTEGEAIARVEQAGLRATYVNYFDEKSVPEPLRQSLVAVRKGAVFAAQKVPGERLSRGSDYLLAVRR
jgi:hypothetical protein